MPNENEKGAAAHDDRHFSFVDHMTLTHPRQGVTLSAFSASSYCPDTVVSFRACPEARALSNQKCYL